MKSYGRPKLETAQAGHMQVFFGTLLPAAGDAMRQPRKCCGPLKSSKSLLFFYCFLEQSLRFSPDFKPLWSLSEAREAPQT